MSQPIERITRQLMQGLEQSMHQYVMMVQRLAEEGKISSDEADWLLVDYQAQLVRACPLLDEQEGLMRIAPNERQRIAEELLNINWRLQLYGEESGADANTNAVSAYLNRKRQRALRKLDTAIVEARHLLNASGTIRQDDSMFIRMDAVHQITRETTRLRVPCLYLGQQPLHYNNDLVDAIEQRTQCQATIFQRVPDGFLRIATNIRSLNGQRAIGTYIPTDSKVSASILQGKPYRGSAFVLNNWYLSIYEPLFIDDVIVGILYVGIKESLELTAHQEMGSKQIEDLLQRLSLNEASDDLTNRGTAEMLVRLLGEHPHTASNYPLMDMGLKEVAAMLVQEREKRQSQQLRGASHRHGTEIIAEYIRSNLAEDISIDLLAELLCMSKASFYRYFKSKFNATPTVFINQERLKQAQQMMQLEPGLSIQAVCQAVGFKSTSYFIKLFRQQYGVTPKQYQLRQQAASSGPANL